VSCWPDVAVHERNHESDDVLILACDGVWDVLSSEAAVDTVRSILDAGEHNVALVAEELIDIALHQGKLDTTLLCILHMHEYSQMSVLIDIPPYPYPPHPLPCLDVRIER
jgi:serine/threonine protein phosphatase PrpC